MFDRINDMKYYYFAICIFLLVNCNHSNKNNSLPEISKMPSTEEDFIQTKPGDGFVYNGSFNMEEALSTTESTGEKIKVLRYVRENVNSEVDVFLVNMISFPYEIADTLTYQSSLLIDYQKIGTASKVNFKGKNAVQVDEDVFIEGLRFKQRSTSLLHRNIAYTFILTSNSSNFIGIYKQFLDDIYLE